MSKSKIFVWGALSFAVGIFLASHFSIERTFVSVVAAIAIAGFAFGILLKRRGLILPAFFLFCAAVGALRLQVSFSQNQYQNIFESKQQLEGVIVEDIDIRTDKQLITFLPEGYHQRILITTTKGQQFFYGDRLAINGKIKEPKDFEDFDYTGYLERFGVYAVAQYPKILILKSGQGNGVKHALLKIKYAFTKRTSLLLKEPQSSLLLGILIGARKTLPQEIIDNFNSTGTSHIIAVSGFNITIIISSLGFIAAFTIIAGASASVLRAGIMGVALLISFNIGRQYNIIPALFLAGLIMLVFNPRILYWDIGFQLSFAATLGIIYFVPLLQALAETWPKLFGAKDALITTLSAIVATLPLILFYFGRLSLSAPLVNILVLPLVPYAMLFGFLTILPIVGNGFAFLANIILLYILKVTALFASLPFSSLDFPILPWMFVCFCLLVLFLYQLLKYSLEKRGNLSKTSKVVPTSLL